MSRPLDTLEPLIDAVREGVESRGWTLSGLQKTTSYEFEGRWSGDSTRSAYLFFHRSAHPDVSVDVYLDETSRGLRGNLALVVDLREMGSLPPVPETLAALAGLARAHLPEGYRTPVSLRLRLPDSGDEVAAAEIEVRLKLTLPTAALEAGAGAVAALSGTAVDAFDRILADGAADRFRSPAGG